jgi:hypothetical protein
VGLLVVVGIVGLQILDDSGPGGSTVTSTTAGSTTTTSGVTTTTVAGTGTTGPTATTGVTATTSAASTSTTTGAKLRDNSKVKIVVYNASDITGAAKNMRDRLKASGYNVIGIGNTKQQQGVTVACRKGFAGEGQQLASTGVGVSGAKVIDFPSQPPSDAGDADCLVFLGTT